MGRNVTANVAIPAIGNLSAQRIYIEDVFPSVDAGRFPVKRIAGEPVEVWADVFREGHDVIASELLWRRERDTKWRRVAMQHQDNDRWHASFTPTEPGRYFYVIEAWTDEYATWRRGVLLKREAGQNVELEMREGRALLDEIKPRSRPGREAIAKAKETFYGDGVAGAP